MNDNFDRKLMMELAMTLGREIGKKMFKGWCLSMLMSFGAGIAVGWWM